MLHLNGPCPSQGNVFANFAVNFPTDAEAKPVAVGATKMEGTMANAPDFEFSFGQGRYLKGRSWRGVVALALILAALVSIVCGGAPLAARLVATFLFA